MTSQLRVAVLIPCFNEQSMIEKVVLDFKSALQGSQVFVYDNNSSDQTAEIARRAGAFVRSETQQGKGNVVRRMFADIEADVYVLVDGDDTYDATAAPGLVKELVENRLDLVNASRIETSRSAYRAGHRFGNALLTRLVGLLFEYRFKDMLSGYRALSRRFVKSFPAASKGFEIETEIIVHSLEMRMPVAELDTNYKERPAGSYSKLRTFRDGFRILFTIVKLLKEERPFKLCAALFALFALASLALGIPIILEFLETGLVPRLPTAVLVMGLMLTAFLFLVIGIVLETIVEGHRDVKRLFYLSIPGPGWIHFSGDKTQP